MAINSFLFLIGHTRTERTTRFYIGISISTAAVSIGTHSSTAYAVCTLPLTYNIGNKSPTLVGLTISKYKEQIVIYNNALSVHYTSVISQINRTSGMV